MLKTMLKWMVAGLVSLTLLLGMALAAVPGAQAMAAGAKLKVRADRDNAAEAIFLAALADCFDIDTKVVLDLSKECDDEDLIHVFYRSGETGRPVRRIMREERRDHVRKRESFIRFVSDYYGVSKGKVRKWLNRGLTPKEIVVGLDIADEYDVDPDKVMEMRAKGQSWDKIRKHVDNRRRPPRPRGPKHRRGPRYGKKIIINF